MTSYEEKKQSKQDNYYEVESILKKKIEKGKTFYKVKWLGYPLTEASWEPYENLSQAKRSVKEFEKKFLNKKRKATLRSLSKKSKDDNLSRKSNSKSKTKKTETSKEKKSKPRVITITLPDINEEDKSTEQSESKSIINQNIINGKQLESIKEMIMIDNVLHAKVELQSSYGKNKIPIKQEMIMPINELKQVSSLKLLEFFEKNIMDKPSLLENFK